MRKLSNVVIVREDRLGDSCLSLPVLEAFHNLSPDTRATWVCQAPWKSLFEGHPSVRRVLPAPRKPSVTEAFLLGRRFRTERPDAILLLRASKRWQLFARFTGSPIRVGHTARPELGPLTHDAWIELRRRTHVSRRALDVLATALDVEVPDYPAVLRVADAAWKSANAEVQSLKPMAGYFIVQLGTGGTNAGMPPEFFGSVATAIHSRTGLVPVLTGAANEESLVSVFRQNFSGPNVSAVGKTSVLGLCALVADAKFILSADTGTVHVGAAVGTPSVVAMPKLALSVEEWRPWKVDQEILTPTQYCRQCERTGCRGDLTCVRSILPEAAIEASMRLLSRL